MFQSCKFFDSCRTSLAIVYQMKNKQTFLLNIRYFLKLIMFSCGNIGGFPENNQKISFLFSFRPFPSVRGGHSVSSFSKPFCLQHRFPLHQLPAYLLLQHLKIFSLVSLFSSLPVTPFPSSFFLHTLGLSS